MTLTETYTQLHIAFAEVAVAVGIAPFSARVLLAIDDLGDGVRSDLLERVLENEGSATRRALAELYKSGHATGVGSVGGPRRRGVRSRVSLTTRGKAAVLEIRERASAEQLAAA